MQPMSIRSMIHDLQVEVRDNDVTPVRATEIISTLSALLGNVNDNIAARQMLYNKVLLSLLDASKTAAKARMQAECTPEYESLLEAKNTRELVMEMMRGLKYLVKAKLEEMREVQYGG